jgi:hypothetical protein
VPPSWIDDEPGWAWARHELACALRRARALWLRTLIATLVVTALVTLYRARQQRTFEASIVMRVVEESFDEDTAPPTQRELTKYLRDVALSRAKLLGLIERHDLYPDKMGPDPSRAIEQMNDDIELKVVQNYFAPERYIEGPIRSARIVIAYRGRDPDVALVVARELGELITQEETRRRQLLTSLSAAHLDDAVAGLRHSLIEARREQARINLVVDKTPMDVIRLRDLTDRIAGLEQQLEQLTFRNTNLALRSALEGRSEGMRFEVVDAGRPPRVLLTHFGELMVLAVVLFFFSLPLAALAVGVMDARLRDLDQLRRLGVEPLGHVPGFSGADVGSYRQRTRSFDAPASLREKTKVKVA